MIERIKKGVIFDNSTEAKDKETVTYKMTHSQKSFENSKMEALWCYNCASCGMIVNAILPVDFFMISTTSFCDMLVIEIPFMEISSSPDCNRPSCAAMP